MKRLMLLGGSYYLLPVIREAHELGYYVITCDFLPENIAHKYSDEYVNVSIIDKEAVLNAAKELNIDGIMSFATDPGVVTAAYVAESLGLPNVGPYESVCILQNKARFRKFLSDNGFTVPNAKGYKSKEDALADAGLFTYPVIVKPVDSAGSKGVTRVDSIGELADAIDAAFAKSFSDEIIIEDFIEKAGCSSDSDCFSVDGDLSFVSFNNQRFDESAENEYAPAAFSWPSTLPGEKLEELDSELKRLIRLLNMRTAVYNVETRVGKDGRAYIMEVSPRGGGNRLCEMLKYATGQNLIRNAVLASVGEPVEPLAPPEYTGNIAQVILHSNQEGIFREVWISEEVRPKVLEMALYIEPGTYIKEFSAANFAVGSLVVRFDSPEELAEYMLHPNSWEKVIVT